jgi:hypothetical protein
MMTRSRFARTIRARATISGNLELVALEETRFSPEPTVLATNFPSRPTSSSRLRSVERYAVIDDEDDELDELPLFQPSAAVGLTDRIADGVSAYLSGKTHKDMRCTRIERLFQNLRSVLKGHPG